MNKNIYLGGGSWGCGYFIGIYKAIKELYPDLKLNIQSHSAGVLIALCMILELSIEETKQIYLDVSLKAKKNGVLFKMSKYHDIVLSKILDNDKTIYKKFNNRLGIGISIFPNKYIKKKIWFSNEELKNDIKSSMNIPFYCMHNSKVNNIIALDGGLSFNILKLNDNILSIGLSNKYDIYGNISLKSKIFPSNEENLDKMIDKGYHDFKNFNLSKKKKKNKENNNILFKLIIINFLWILRIIIIPFFYFNNLKIINKY